MVMHIRRALSRADIAADIALLPADFDDSSTIGCSMFTNMERTHRMERLGTITGRLAAKLKAARAEITLSADDGSSHVEESGGGRGMGLAAASGPARGDDKCADQNIREALAHWGRRRVAEAGIFGPTPPLPRPAPQVA